MTHCVINLVEKKAQWDIFCCVVDNYGDIGVTWRLAKQLTNEYPINITLWVDDLNSFSHILPQLNPHVDSQTWLGVQINRWTDPLTIHYRPGDVLIEAFACNLPASVLDTLEKLHKEQHLDDNVPSVPLWLNLEYLSAESWVDDCHGLPSLQQNGLKKYFYFPGFTAQTGGLICEMSLAKQRKKWQTDELNKLQLFKGLGLKNINTEDTVISVFSYENTALMSLCLCWMKAETKVHVLLPKGRSLTSISELLPCPIAELTAGQQIKHNNLILHILPMTDQEGYDKLLWSCDFNIVRGEDSFLRAQWAAKPFIWHIYPQEEDYHLIKLAAFMSRYCHNLTPELNKLCSELNTAFNTEQGDKSVHHWKKLQLQGELMLQHAKQWPNNTLIDADLASRLVQFVKNS